MVPRDRYLGELRRGLELNPAVALLGPRQSGKTTLARALAEETGAEYFDLESPTDSARLETPMLALERLAGLVVIDEAQRRPDLFAVLRVLIDRPESRARFLLLGSAAPRLTRGLSESLAGRVGFVDLSGFDLSETGPADFRMLWERGGLPRAYLARDAPASFDWRQDFIRTFLERDVPQLGVRIPAEQLRRFWTMLAHYHGQVLNGAELARSLAVSEGTVRSYLDLLSGAYVVRQLQPWFENLKKRQVKSPKVYVRDTGLLHALLMVANERELQSHPKVGASWEGFVVEQVLTQLGSRNAYFWATHAGAELDLFISTEGKRIGFEVKHADAPRTTKSMHVALADLQLEHLFVIYPGDVRYPLLPKATALPIADVARLPAIISGLPARHLRSRKTGAVRG